MDIVISHLHCPSCGNPSFDEYSDIGVKTRFDIEVDKHLNKVHRLYSAQVKAFEDFLEKFPLLAYSNRFGKRIHEELKERKFPSISLEGEFFRARPVESSEVITKDGMYNPPIGKPKEGRFNHAGQSHLYLSNDKATAIKEVIKSEHPILVWCQKFQIFGEVNNILDLTFDWSKITPLTSTLLLALHAHNSIGRTDRNEDLWRPDYYLTRFIMDCAKEQGYNGIKYHSTKDSAEFNVVLFNPSEINIEAIGNPHIEIFINKAEYDELQSNIVGS